MAAFGSRETLLEDWRKLNIEEAPGPSWLQEAIVFDIVEHLTVDEIRNASRDDAVGSIWAFLAAGRQETIYRDAKLAESFKGVAVYG